MCEIARIPEFFVKLVNANGRALNSSTLVSISQKFELNVDAMPVKFKLL